jgi:hypothetical protein
MRKTLVVVGVAAVAASLVVCAATREELEQVLQPLIQPGVTAEMNNGCDSEYEQWEAYTVTVEVEQTAYVMAFFITPEGLIMKELPFDGCTPKRPPALEPGETYTLPDDWYPEPDWCVFYVRDLVGLHALLVIASEARLSIPYSVGTRDGYDVHWLQANSPSKAVDLILDALGELPEGSWWAGTVCFFTVLP